MLTVIDEYTRESTVIVVAQEINSDDVLHRLAVLSVKKGPSNVYYLENHSPLGSGTWRKE